jgi:hypothetical protein
MMNYLGGIQNLSGIVHLEISFKQTGSGSAVVKEVHGPAPKEQRVFDMFQ